MLKWAGIAKPDVIVLENVEEFQTWGPLIDNQPCPRRKGMTFKRWVTQLRNIKGMASTAAIQIHGVSAAYLHSSICGASKVCYSARNCTQTGMAT